MNTLPKQRTFLAVALLTALTNCLSASPVLVLTPSPFVSGGPGGVVGWGFTIVNDTADYLEFSSSQFCDAPVVLTPVLVCTSPSTGVFNDIIVGNDPIIAPNSSLSEAFDPIGFTTGVGYLAIDPGAPVPSSDIGQIVLIYDGYETDPSIDPNANQVVFSAPLAADASVNVTTPEAATGGLAIMALSVLALIGLFANRRKGRRLPAFSAASN